MAALHSVGKRCPAAEVEQKAGEEEKEYMLVEFTISTGMQTGDVGAIARPA